VHSCCQIWGILIYRKWCISIYRLQGSTTIISGESNCANIIRVDLGSFSGYYAENKTEYKSFKVKWSLTNTKYDFGVSSGEMGLIRRNIRHITNSRDNEDFEFLKPKSISCKEIPYDF